MSNFKSPPEQKITHPTVVLSEPFFDFFPAGADESSTLTAELLVCLEPLEGLGRNLSAVRASDLDVEHKSLFLPLDKKIPRLLQVGEIRPQVMLLALLILAGAGGFVNFFMSMD